MSTLPGSFRKEAFSLSAFPWEKALHPAYGEQQCRTYLRRIGIENPEAPELPFLRKLVTAHQRQVPYENLDVLRGIPLEPSPEALFRKIVTRGRGGFCFELNLAFGCLLEGLGYPVTHLAARFLLGETGVPVRRHHVLVVRAEGQEFLCDVGIMREGPRMPLPCIQGRSFSDGVSRYRLEEDPFFGTLLLQQLPGKDWKALYGFTREPQLPEDFYPVCHWCQFSPDSPFNRHLMVGIDTPAGAWNLVGRELRYIEGGRILTRQVLETEELGPVLQSRFRLFPKED